MRFPGTKETNSTSKEKGVNKTKKKKKKAEKSSGIRTSAAEGLSEWKKFRGKLREKAVLGRNEDSAVADGESRLGKRQKKSGG